MKTQISRRDFTKVGASEVITLFLTTSMLLCALDAGAQKPNVVLIVADDLGIGQVSCYGEAGSPRTPNIDRLAKEGIRAENSYSAHPMCWPSRASILSGRYYQRFTSVNPLPANERMISQYLAGAGYYTACIGKWHNTGSIGEWDGNPQNHPSGWGFNEFFGFLGGMHDYLDPNWGVHFKEGRNQPHKMPIYDGSEPVQKITYLTDDFTDRAISFIERNSTRPFFLYLPYNAIHHPLQFPEKYREKDDVASMLKGLDVSVGRVLDALDRLKLSDNTMVIFIGDNGGYTGNGPLRGKKGSNFEGGIRVPLLIRWPRSLPGGRIFDKPVMQIDLTPTILGAAGIDQQSGQAFDGANLLPYLRSEKKGAPHEVLHWGDSGGRWAVRRGYWKLVSEYPKGSKSSPQAIIALYNLKDDIGEQSSLLEKEPAVAEELKALHRRWIDDVTGSRKKTTEKQSKNQ